jgi:L-threonylcarbamoyladenylate synthase
MGLVNQSQLIEHGQKGTLISFPTDTVPALGIRPDRAGALFEVKERSLGKPLILMGAGVEAFRPYWRGAVAEIDLWQRVMAAYWPGALTLVLPIDHPHGAIMNPENPTTLGFRIPDHPQALAILQETGPLATTSANRSGEPALTDLAEIALAFPQAQVLDRMDPPGSGVASTVVQWSRQQADPGWQILRSGAVVPDLPGFTAS